MMRPILLLAAIALAACDEAEKVFGPSDGDIRDALTAFYKPPAFEGWPEQSEQKPFADAKILRTGDCEPVGATFFCDVDYELAGGRRIAATVDMVKMPRELGGWKTLSGPIVVPPASN